MDPTVHGYSLTARKPAAGVGATWGFAGTPPSRVASTLAYVSAASDLSEVRKPPFFEAGMRPAFPRRPQRQPSVQKRGATRWRSLQRALRRSERDVAQRVPQRAPQGREIGSDGCPAA